MPWTKFLIEKEEPGYDENPKITDRKFTAPQAICETLSQALALDPNIFVMGQGVDDPTGMFGTTCGLQKRFGPERVFDTPLSENALTGIATGAALTGLKPIYLHNRPDFLLLAMDQIINHAAKLSYMFAGKLKVPLVIMATIGKGWGSGPQHSQSLHGLFLHIPGLKLVMPSTAYDAKGLLVSSIADNNPVLFIEHRWLFKHTSYVPEELYAIPFGKGLVRRFGNDVTIIGISYMVIEALRAAEELAKQGIEAEVLDPRTLKPLDEEIILQSIKKTGRLIIVDTDWLTGGTASEIAAFAAEKAFNFLKAPVKRIAWPDIPVPSGHTLEEAFYPTVQTIVQNVKEIIQL